LPAAPSAGRADGSDLAAESFPFTLQVGWESFVTGSAGDSALLAALPERLHGQCSRAMFAAK